MSYHLLLFTCIFNLFYFIKFFIVFYFINTLFKGRKAQKLRQASIKIFKISYFSFTFKLNEKNKVLLKIWFGDGRYKKIVLGEWGLMFYKWVGNVFKKGELDKKGVDKKGGGCDNQINYYGYMQNLHICWLDSTRSSPSLEAQKILITMAQISKHTHKNITLDGVGWDFDK